MKITDHVISIDIGEYPLGILENEDQSFSVYSGEGHRFHYDYKGVKLGEVTISSVGFNNVSEAESFAILTCLSGEVSISKLPDLNKKLGKKITFPILINEVLYFIKDQLLYFCRFKESFSIQRVEKITHVEQLYKCGDKVFVVCEMGWFLIGEEFSPKFLGQYFVTISSAAYMSKNSTFHFTLSSGEMGILHLNMDSSIIEEPMITQAAGPFIKILGSCDSDKIAMSYYNQLVLLISNSEQADQYINVIIDKLKEIPKKVLNHKSEPYFLVQEDNRSASLWTTLLPEAIWKQEFNADICYMKFSVSFFYIGCTDGAIHVYNFS
ncbi:MAG: hypothetical protein HOP07_13380 [Bacteriovoracaceae bacterium]|nr:hypothetical protein [Bacteriovoracaceae bacterium]